MWNAQCAPLPESQCRDSGPLRTERGGFEPPQVPSAGTASAAARVLLLKKMMMKKTMFSVPPSNGGEYCVDACCPEWQSAPNGSEE